MPVKLTNPEEIEQASFVQWLNAKSINHFAVVNENPMSFKNRKVACTVASKSKVIGKVKGVSDLVIFLDTKIVFIEMKRKRKVLKSGKLSNEKLHSDEQWEFLTKVNQYPYAEGYIAYGCDEAIQIIESLQ